MTVILSTLEQIEVRAKKAFSQIKSPSLGRVKKLFTLRSNRKKGQCINKIQIHLDLVKTTKELKTIRTPKRYNPFSMFLHCRQISTQLPTSKLCLIWRTKSNQSERANRNLLRTNLNGKRTTNITTRHKLQTSNLAFLL